MRWTAGAVIIASLFSLLVGCGGGAGLSPAPPGTDAPEPLQIGPLFVVPASAAGFTVKAVDSEGTASFAALYGSQINRLGAQALLDRIVFASYRDGFMDIWACNLDGTGLVQLTNNGADEGNPHWSPDGRRVVFDRKWPGQDREIMVMNADGSGIKALTNDSADQRDPCWSPDGGRIAYDSLQPGNWDIYSAYDDGTYALNLTANAAEDTGPSWCPQHAIPEILFSSNRSGDAEIYRMDENGGSVVAATTNGWEDAHPDWRHDGSAMAWVANLAPGPDIVMKDFAGGAMRNLSAMPDLQTQPAWSTDGRWIAYTSLKIPNLDLYIQETAPPFQRFRVTTPVAVDEAPDLGGPVMQLERMLIGPNGSDWGGANPVWSSAYAGVVAFTNTGYLNFVRIGVAAADAATIRMDPLANPGLMLAGVSVRARQIVNLREDAGRNREPSVWDLASWNAGAVLLYFDSFTGKLNSVLVSRDVVYPSAADGPGVAQQVRDGRLVVEGSFAAVLDATGAVVARDVSAVELDADGRFANARQEEGSG